MIDLFKILLQEPRNVFLLIIAILVSLGAWFIIDGTARRKLLREYDSLKRFITTIQNGIKEGGAAKFDAYRNILLYCFVFLGVIFTLKSIIGGLLIILIALLLYLIFQPVDELPEGKESPYIKLKRVFHRTQREKYRDELYQTAIQLKNIIVSNKGKSVTTNYILNKLMKYTEATKPFFAQLISMNMKNEQEEAIKMFNEVFDDRLAGDFVYIVNRLDTTSPEDFMPLLDTLILNFQEQQKTREARMQQKNETLLFMMASAQLMVLVINFILLVFMSTLAQINTL